ncbi:unnamed protein product [Adineta steineri]|uniref:Uncharacterized protein n=1 Tax=Adineta steineri TaxID=433720 RepID=A0A814WBS0_9BILA|nr:unnamed protein product [Adineta steineri]CAF3750667.1 unnamed protein product [Adineta steineri]
MATTYDAQNEKFKSFINYIQGVLKINKFNTVEQAYVYETDIEKTKFTIDLDHYFKIEDSILKIDHEQDLNRKINNLINVMKKKWNQKLPIMIIQAISNRENLMNNPKYVGILNDLIVSTSNLPLTNKQK